LLTELIWSAEATEACNVCFPLCDTNRQETTE